MVRFFRKNCITIILLLAVAGAVYYFMNANGRRRAIAGIPEPIQKEASGNVTLKIDDMDVLITFQYSYDISGLVVSSMDYSDSSFMGQLIPMDVALAWGKVAEYNTKLDFKWEQSNRHVSFYFPDGMTNYFSEDYAISHCSNNHLIPADKSIRKKVHKIKKGDYIRIQGYLVNYRGEDERGNIWAGNSSNVRDDIGANSCEIIYVTSVEWLD